MRFAVAATNLILGTAYTGYGVITAIELKRGWRTMGFSHFAAAWIAMAFTCGPHHLFHGLHVGFEGRNPGPLDLAVVLVGLPVGVIWLALRVEAFEGGRGDRFITGDPGWLRSTPTLAAVYATALIAAGLRIASTPLHLSGVIIPNVLLFFLYMTIGYFLLRTQLRNRGLIGGWSVSGISLMVVFPTCAIMHAVFLLYAATGQYAFDIHGFVIDWIGVPAAAYFLWVVRGLYRDALKDWNRTMGGERELVPVPVEALR